VDQAALFQRLRESHVLRRQRACRCAAYKFRDHAEAFSVSPNGNLIAFGANPGPFGDREIWLMNMAGGDARKLYETGDDSAIGGLRWSPDTQRVIYNKTDRSGDTFISRAFVRSRRQGPCEICGQTKGTIHHAEDYGPTREAYFAALHSLCRRCHLMLRRRFKFPGPWAEYKERCRREAKRRNLG
jgi:dipeptidyl aminopeptidase/acylaminoacyl peptidase